MLRVEPGREDDFAYWQEGLGVYPAIIRALDATEPEPTGQRPQRPLPRWLRAEASGPATRPAAYATLAPAVS